MASVSAPVCAVDNGSYLDVFTALSCIGYKKIVPVAVLLVGLHSSHPATFQPNHLHDQEFFINSNTNLIPTAVTVHGKLHMASDKHEVLCNEEPTTQFAKPTRRNSWNRALVLDTESGCVDIHLKSDIDEGEYYKLKLKKGQKKISIYMGQDKQTRLKTEDIEESDVFLARLNLDHLGLANRTLLLLGYLSTLYVSAPWSDVASQIPTVR